MTAHTAPGTGTPRRLGRNRRDAVSSTCRIRCRSTADGSFTRSAWPTRPTARSRPGVTTRSWSATRSAATLTRPGSRRRPRAEHARRVRSRGSRRRGRQGTRLVGRDDRPRQGLRHRPVLRHLHEPARRLPRDHGTLVARPGDGRPYGSDFPVITVADMVRTERAFLDELGIERLAAVAGGSLGGMQAFEWAIMFPDQVDAVVAIASTHALHPQGLAWNAIAREAIMRDPAWQGGHYHGHGGCPERRHGHRANDRPHHVPLGAGAECQVRPAASVRRRHPLHGHRAGVRGRELPAPPGRLVRQAVRRQHLPLHVTGADLLRSCAPARRRIASRGARGRYGADAADRFQLRLALPASRHRERSRTRFGGSASRSSST